MADYSLSKHINKRNDVPVSVYKNCNITDELNLQFVGKRGKKV